MEPLFCQYMWGREEPRLWEGLEDFSLAWQWQFYYLCLGFIQAESVWEQCDSDVIGKCMFLSCHHVGGHGYCKQGSLVLTITAINTGNNMILHPPRIYFALYFFLETERHKWHCSRKQATFKALHTSCRNTPARHSAWSAVCHTATSVRFLKLKEDKATENWSCLPNNAWDYI